jgi:methanogenic corrinoid protein MtbC1
VTSPALAHLRDDYLRAQLAGDRREAVRLVISEGLRVASVLELQELVIGAAQEEIGRLWLTGQVSIAQEHMATAISQLSLAALFERARVEAPLGRKVLIACVEGELHDLPARLVADYLEIVGFTVRYLGANVPTEHLIMMVRSEQPDLIGMSVTMSYHLTALRDVVTRLRAFTEIPIVVGGQALTGTDVATELGVHLAGKRSNEVVALTRRLAEQV